MAQTINDALRTAKLFSDGLDYKMIHLPPQAITAAAGVLAEIGEPFSALIVDKDEVTLIISTDDLDLYSKRLSGSNASTETYRLITLDVVLEPTLVGFIARISSALASAGITIMPFAAFSRDHLLVPSASFDQAMSVLEALQKQT